LQLIQPDHILESDIFQQKFQGRILKSARIVARNHDVLHLVANLQQSFK